MCIKIRKSKRINFLYILKKIKISWLEAKEKLDKLENGLVYFWNIIFNNLAKISVLYVISIMFFILLPYFNSFRFFPLNDIIDINSISHIILFSLFLLPIFIILFFIIIIFSFLIYFFVYTFTLLRFQKFWEILFSFGAIAYSLILLIVGLQIYYVIFVYKTNKTALFNLILFIIIAFITSLLVYVKRYKLSVMGLLTLSMIFLEANPVFYRDFLLYLFSINNRFASINNIACIQKEYAYDIEKLICSEDNECKILNNILGRENSKKYICFRNLTIIWKGRDTMWIANNKYVIPLPREAFYAGDVFPELREKNIDKKGRKEEKEK